MKTVRREDYLICCTLLFSKQLNVSKREVQFFSRHFDRG